VDSEELPEHLCELLIQTMRDVYGAAGPRVLEWDGPDGRPTVQQIQDMFAFAFDYVKYGSSSGLSPRMPPSHVDVITDHDLPRPPANLDDGMGMDPNESSEFNVLDLILAIISFAIWLVELTIWLATILPALINDLLTWPIRELIHQLLVIPAWTLYMLSRQPLVLEGFLAPKPEEISMGLVTLGMTPAGPWLQTRADLGDPSGFAVNVPLTEPSGLDLRGAPPQGWSKDAAYPRAMLTDLQPAFWNGAPLDGVLGPSEFVAPWRYPDHNLGGRRNGWEAPRTHVGPFAQGQDALDLMNGRMPGSDSARARYEAARTQAETEAVATELMAMAGAHLGNPIDYGAYLMGKLSGTWVTATEYVGHDDAAPLPDFNLDSDRGYAYQCWDYIRHPSSTPPSPHPSNTPLPPLALPPTDTIEPDQWRCAPSDIVTVYSQIAGPLSPSAVAQRVRDLYGYVEPCTVPQRYKPGDNIHHVSVYDPLKRLHHEYLPHPSMPPPGSTGCDDVDLQVSDQEILDVMLSPTGRPVP
jgi:hypothetical protein